ncbi:hypothetical protein AVEN_117725-1 [Araneus ventricosus]|uniref:Uncharacterized protein n=1 Tax=Araneus ventricosus TaxID=182803 RepID=A0A4Y2P6S7_ARAVE|nr:hypothetical protein AVEN_141268-1 [Araneus ventricosus]GBN46151.1 hypothetical protein AVEN_117725-1 [Araneus ventricosus]
MAVICLLTKPYPNVAFKFKCNQFPIAITFSMTINKAQEQTIEKIWLDLSKPGISQSSAKQSPKVRSPTGNHEPGQDFQRGSSSPAPYMRADGLE